MFWFDRLSVNLYWCCEISTMKVFPFNNFIISDVKRVVRQSNASSACLFRPKLLRLWHHSHNTRINQIELVDFNDAFGKISEWPNKRCLQRAKMFFVFFRSELKRASSYTPLLCIWFAMSIMYNFIRSMDNGLLP